MNAASLLGANGAASWERGRPEPKRGGDSEGRRGKNGGEEGIRTLEKLLTSTPLAGERLRPLGHLSVARWIKKSRDTINRRKLDASKESDAARMTLRAPAPKRLAEQVVRSGAHGSGPLRTTKPCDDDRPIVRIERHPRIQSIYIVIPRPWDRDATETADRFSKWRRCSGRRGSQCAEIVEAPPTARFLRRSAQDGGILIGSRCRVRLRRTPADSTTRHSRDPDRPIPPTKSPNAVASDAERSAEQTAFPNKTLPAMSKTWLFCNNDVGKVPSAAPGGVIPVERPAGLGKCPLRRGGAPASLVRH